MKINSIYDIIKQYFANQFTTQIFEETYQQVISPIVERDTDIDNNTGC